MQTDTAADYATQLESRLTALISRVAGAGKTAVMVTLESGSESIYATDTADVYKRQVQYKSQAAGAAARFFVAVDGSSAGGRAVRCV